MNLSEVTAGIPAWVQIIVALLAIGVPALLTYFAATRRNQNDTRQNQSETGSKQRDQLLEFITTLQQQLGTQGERISSLEDTQRALERHVAKLELENLGLRMWAKTLARQLEEQGVTPAPYEDFQPADFS